MHENSRSVGPSNISTNAKPLSSAANERRLDELPVVVDRSNVFQGVPVSWNCCVVPIIGCKVVGPYSAIIAFNSAMKQSSEDVYQLRPIVEEKAPFTILRISHLLLIVRMLLFLLS